MGKKEAKKETSKEVKAKADSTRGPRKGTRIAFLRELYAANPNISNEKALEKLLAKFPESNADIKSIITWKKMLRDEGLQVPLQRKGVKTKSAAKKTASAEEMASPKKPKKVPAKKAKSADADAV